MNEFIWHSDITESKTCLIKQSLIFRFHRYNYRNYNLFKVRFDLIQKFTGTSTIEQFWKEPLSDFVRRWHVYWSHVLEHYIINW